MHTNNTSGRLTTDAFLQELTPAQLSDLAGAIAEAHWEAYRPDYSRLVDLCLQRLEQQASAAEVE